MIELDPDSLMKLRDDVQKEIDWIERRRRMKPAFEAMLQSNRELQFMTNVDMKVKHILRTRDSVLRLENLALEYAEKNAKAQERRIWVLKCVRKRTAALQLLLESFN